MQMLFLFLAQISRPGTTAGIVSSSKHFYLTPCRAQTSTILLLIFLSTEPESFPLHRRTRSTEVRGKARGDGKSPVRRESHFILTSGQTPFSVTSHHDTSFLLRSSGTWDEVEITSRPLQPERIPEALFSTQTTTKYAYAINTPSSRPDPHIILAI